MLVSTLVLLGISVIGAVFLALAILLVSLLFRYCVRPNSGILQDGPVAFALVLSVTAAIAGVAGLHIAALSLLIFFLSLCLTRGLRQRRTQPTVPLTSDAIAQNHDLVRRSYFLLPLVLTALGWQSLVFFSIGVLICEILLRIQRGLIWKIFACTALVTGFGFSLIRLDGGRGQFWVSVDQLYRSTIASGVSTWTYSDFSGATGGVLRYHWLGEAVAGMIARMPRILAVESVTVVAPTLGVLVSLGCLMRLGTQFRFGSTAVQTASVAAIILSREFDIYSIGSLWGISIFLCGLVLIGELMGNRDVNSHSQWPKMAVIAFVTPLVALSQSTLGANFVLLTFAVVAFTVAKRLLSIRSACLLLASQFISILTLRTTLLYSDLNDIYDPTISLANVLQFRGIELYLGDNRVYVAGVSILFLLVVLQKGTGLLLANRSDFANSSFGLLLCATAVSSLVLANTFSIGGPESQQSRFLSPLVVIVGFSSLLLLFREVLARWNSPQRRPAFYIFSFLIFTATVAASFVGTRLFESEWSRERTAGIGMFIAMTQLFVAALWWVTRRSAATANQGRRLLAVAILGVVIIANARSVSHLVEYQLTARDVERAHEFTGGADGLACLQEIRLKTAKNAIVASNWFRIGPPSRLPKNFLVSAWTERRLYLDGPLYIQTSVDRPTDEPNAQSNWIEFRHQVTDEFAEHATPESYEALRKRDVEYFVVDTQMPMPTTWEPLAEVVFEREPCKVLKLRT